MATTPQAGTQLIDALKQALVRGDAKTLAGLYDDQAVIEIVNQNSPPKSPRRLSGQAEILAYYEDVCSRALEHKVEAEIESGTRAAYLERCIYPDGVNVLATAMMTTRDGRILYQTTIEAWDQ